MTIHTPAPATDPSRTSAAAPADVVLVHDYLLVMRGAERTFEAMTACYPNGAIATLLYDPVRTEGRFSHRRVRTSFLQPLAADQRRFRRFLPLLPLAAERLAVDDARVVISSSSAFAHGVRPAPDAVHVCYCYSPFRYVWHERDRAERGVPAVARPAARAFLAAMRRWDIRAAARVTGFIAISELTRQRIRDFYGRDAIIVHPPVDVGRFVREPDPQDYFLMVGEVTRHKNTEIALAAAEQAGVKIKVVGDGPDLARLRKRFCRAEFLGRIDDLQLIDLYAHCKALVVPAIEEFGITMVEAHAAGRPVLAAASGGALEIVTDGLTGVLVKPRSVDALTAALRATDWERFDVGCLRANAERFSSGQFRKRFVAAVADTIAGAAHDQNASTATPARLRSPQRSAVRQVASAGTLPIPGGSLARSRNRP